MKRKEDIDVQADVIEELDWEPSVNASDIGVTVKDGVVTLSGYVPSYAQKRTAERVAMSVAGVRAVAEEIEVRLPGDSKRTDADIAKAILDTIKWDVHIPEEQLKVKVEQGVVTLEGEVEWQYQRKNLIDSVKTLTGVKRINNLVTIQPRLTSGKIREEIRTALERTVDEDAERIDIEIDGGEVRLSGNVRTWMEREEAEQAAWKAPGVTSVENRIEIRPRVIA